MGWASDLKVIYHLTCKRIRGQTHAQRLESFYHGQADAYDDFRRRLLPGREQLYQSLEVPPEGVWIDFGGGTGANLEALGPRIDRLRRIYIVDLSPSLLEVARRRVDQRGWTNVRLAEADATLFVPEEGYADVVTFSYSLSMIPDWFGAIDNAHRLLRQGGQIGVIDFYVSRKFPHPSRRRHPWWTRTFWPIWFGRDNIYPSPDHLPYLAQRFDIKHLDEEYAPIPYLPLARVPYYRLIGQKGRLTPQPQQSWQPPGLGS